uniref:Tyrosinase copper-binding domain-containing protein n=2 Tax=Aureoumbra lagunensis TaxID=44058 RepID=A0A7S3K307_9STRA|mmetsp:Transcript_5661/g.8336  ORF Transcript_5661/g.8336 Transcript_5661/m.8336 type:complete len:655 (+) Transcript_5661:72-2036(+)
MVECGSYQNEEPALVVTDLRTSRPHRIRRFVVQVLIVGLAVIGLTLAVLVGPRIRENGSLSVKLKSKRVDSLMFQSITNWNEESRYAGKQSGKGYPTIREGDIVEPFTVTRFILTNKNSEEIEEDWEELKAAWTIKQIYLDGSETKLMDTMTTSTTYLDITIELIGDIRVYCEIDLLGKTMHLSRVFNVRYVRRNIRKLSDKARNNFFDAVHTVMTLSRSEGQAAYGPNFNELDFFVKIHLNNAGLKSTDKLHDGLGFVTQHVTITDAFERSLRSVDPSVSIPYWSYTEDSSMVTKMGSQVKKLWNLEIWQSGWFGNTTNSKYHTVEEGRWAYQRVTKDSTNEVHNPYGFLRSPWNMNKDPFVARVHKMEGVTYSLSNWPDCDKFYLQNYDYTSWYDWAWAISYAPHGTVHTMIGGYYHSGNLFERLSDILSDSYIESFAYSTLTIIKNLYRDMDDTDVAYPQYCSSDTPQEDCHMICPQGWLKNASGTDEFKSLISKYDWSTNISDDREQFTKFLNIFCITPFSPGEQLDSGSPVDISFWPIHPEIERLLLYKRIISPFENSEWSNPSGSTTYCLYWDSGDCEGHHAYDVTHFSIKVQDDSGEFNVKWLTNGEVYNFMNPNSLKLQYIFDAFDWNHCNEETILFAPLDWTTTA